MYKKMKASRRRAYATIDGERDYQDSLGPERYEPGRGEHTTGESLVLLDSYVRKAQDAYTECAGDDAALHMVRKVAAIAVRCMEANGALPRVGFLRGDSAIEAYIDKILPASHLLGDPLTHVVIHSSNSPDLCANNSDTFCYEIDKRLRGAGIVAYYKGVIVYVADRQINEHHIAFLTRSQTSELDLDHLTGDEAFSNLILNRIDWGI